MRYMVSGAHQETGESATMIIEASSEFSAQRKANQRGLLVESCKQISIATSIPPMDDLVSKTATARHTSSIIAAARPNSPPSIAAPPKVPIAGSPAPAMPPSPTPTAPVSRQVKETAWVVMGFGWLIFISCVLAAVISTGMALDGELAQLDGGGRGTLILCTFSANALAVGLIAIGKPARFAAILGNTTAVVGAVVPPNLPKRFQMLGIVTGRTRGQIIAAVGKPRAVTSTGGKTLIHWAEAGYRIVLRFEGTGDEAVCRGITSEISV